MGPTGRGHPTYALSKQHTISKYPFQRIATLLRNALERETTSKTILLRKDQVLYCRIMSMETVLRISHSIDLEIPPK